MGLLSMPHFDSSQTALDPGLKLEPLPPGGGLSSDRHEPDRTDYAHRTFINLLATTVLLLIALALVWTVQKIEAQEKLMRCLDTGQRECVQLVPPRPGVRLPAR
jgi:hypothetical protein